MAFKIVRNYSCWGLYESLIIPLYGGGVIYEVGKPTIPKKGYGPLAAFKTMKNVEEFKSLNGWKEEPVFRCRVKKDKKSTSVSTPTYHKPAYRLPSGTVLCKSITLTKQIG